MRVLLMMAVMTAALAGCFGGDDGADNTGPDNNSTASPHLDDNSTLSPGNNTTVPPPADNNTTAGNGSATMTWDYDNRTGDVSGEYLIVSGPAAVEESVSVPEGSLMLVFDIGVEGDDLIVRIAPPGCEDTSCEQSVDASAGNASFEQAAPDAGEWRVVFEPDGGPVGGFEASYNLSIAIALPSSGV